MKRLLSVALAIGMVMLAYFATPSIVVATAQTAPQSPATIVATRAPGFAQKSIAPHDDPRRAIVIFGGFGYFDATQHAWLSDLLQRRNGLVAEGRALETAVGQSAAKAFGTPLKAWSTHRIVFDLAGLKEAFTDATGRQSADSGTMLAAFDRVYVIVLTGSFEHHAVRRTPSSRGVFYHPFAMASVSASLLDNNSGTILLSASALGVADPGPQREDPGTQWGPHYRDAYAEGAVRALRQLRTLSDRFDPKASEKVQDSYAVTGVVVSRASQSSQLAATVFGWQPHTGPAKSLASDVPNACAPEVRCPPGANACRAMAGLMISALSEALSNRGFRVLPPVSWADTTLKTGNILRYKLALPAEGLSGMMPMTNIAFDPQRATNKTVAVLSGLWYAKLPLDNAVEVDHTYTAWVNAQVFHSDPQTCATLSASPYAKHDAEGTLVERLPLKDQSVDEGTRQLLFLWATRRAALNLSKP